MFSKTTPPVEPAPDVMHDVSPVPLSHLGLDLPEPPIGWVAYLNGRGVEVTLDDIGRMSVSRVAARQLLIEQREAEARKAELRAESERRAVEADQRWRASLPSGVPAGALPPGMSYAEAVHQAGLDALTYRPRPSLVEDLLDNSSGLTFHSLAPTPEDGEP